MTVTDNQLILAAVCGIAGILAAFMPFIATLGSNLFDHSKGDDASSIWTFLVTAIGVQFLVGVFFNGIVRALDLTMKGGIKVLGTGGAFDLFWKVEVIYATTTSEMITSMIKIIREMVLLTNAFLPVFTVFGGIIWGYTLASMQKHTKGSDGGTSGDWFGYAIKMFLGGMIAAIVYFGWARIASYSLFLPSAIDGGQQTTLIDKTTEYWRHGVGINRGKAASTIILK